MQYVTLRRDNDLGLRAGHMHVPIALEAVLQTLKIPNNFNSRYMAGFTA